MKASLCWSSACRKNDSKDGSSTADSPARLGKGATTLGEGVASRGSPRRHADVGAARLRLRSSWRPLLAGGDLVSDSQSSPEDADGVRARLAGGVALLRGSGSRSAPDGALPAAASRRAHTSSTSRRFFFSSSRRLPSCCSLSSSARRLVLAGLGGSALRSSDRLFGGRRASTDALRRARVSAAPVPAPARGAPPSGRSSATSVASEDWSPRQTSSRHAAPASPIFFVRSQ